MLEPCMATCEKAARAQGSSGDLVHGKEASAQEVRGNNEQFAEAKHLEYKSWYDNGVFGLIDMRRVTPKNYMTGRWVLTIKTDKQGTTSSGKRPDGC